MMFLKKKKKKAFLKANLQSKHFPLTVHHAKKNFNTAIRIVCQKAFYYKSSLHYERFYCHLNALCDWRKWVWHPEAVLFNTGLIGEKRKE